MNNYYRCDIIKIVKGVINIANKHKIKLVLKDTLDKHKISMNKLATTGSIRYPTIHEMYTNPQNVKQVNFSTLSKIIKTLRQLTNDSSINVDDVFIYDETE